MKTDLGDFDMVSPKPMATFDAGLQIIVKDVMQFSLDDPIPLAINHHANVSTWQQFMYLDEDDVKEASYLDGKGSTKFLTKFEQKLFQWMVGYVRENIDTHKPGSDMPAFYTKDGFTRYTQNRRKKNGKYKGIEKGLQNIEEQIMEFVSKLKNTTGEILKKQKERMQGEQSPVQDENQETGAKQ